LHCPPVVLNAVQVESTMQAINIFLLKLRALEMSELPQVRQSWDSCTSTLPLQCPFGIAIFITCARGLLVLAGVSPALM